MKTSDLTDAIIIAASEGGSLLCRNNSGVAKHRKSGKTWFVAYGVGPSGGGGGDLIGLRYDGKFISIEIKVGDDVRTESQKKWHRWIISRGGLSGIARSVEDAISIINGGKGSAK